MYIKPIINLQKRVSLYYRVWKQSIKGPVGGPVSVATWVDHKMLVQTWAVIQGIHMRNDLEILFCIHLKCYVEPKWQLEPKPGV